MAVGYEGDEDETRAGSGGRRERADEDGPQRGDGDDHYTEYFNK